MKYIIDVPDTEGHYDNEYEMVTMRVHYGSTIVDISMDAKPYTEPNRKAIEDEVWEFVRTVTDMTEAQRIQCFGSATCDLDDYLTYQEAKSKYEAWKKWKKQKDEIHVGDEVNPINGTWRGVVVNVDNGDLTIMGSRGISSNGYESKYFSKTGRHFPEVAELLRKMRGNEEE